MKVLVIVPAFNEALNIQKMLCRLAQEAPHADYVVINDCSTDNTEEILKENGLQYISLPVNLGIGGGIQTGYKYGVEKGYDIIIQQDGDGQHDPKYIKDVCAPIEQGEADIVIGSRFINREGFQSSGIRRLGIRFLSRLVRLKCGTVIKDVTSGYRAVNRRYAGFFAAHYPADYPEPEAIVSASLAGARIREVPVIMKSREFGSSSINLRRSVYYMIKVSLAILLCRKES